MPLPPDLSGHLRLQVDSLGFDILDVIVQGGLKRLPCVLYRGALGGAKIFDAHPGADVPGQLAPMWEEKKAVLAGFGRRLADGQGRVEQVKDQQVSEIEPDGIGDAAGFRAEPAGLTLQDFHGLNQPVDSMSDLCSRYSRCCQLATVLHQQTGQGAVRRLPGIG